MYVIKTILYDAQCQKIDVKNGLSLLYNKDSEDNVKAVIGVWNKTNILFESPMSYGDLEDYPRGEKRLFVVSDYRYENGEFCFTVKKETETEKKEGYLVFIKHLNCNIKTSGKVVFTKYTTDSVVLLKDGDYLNIDETKIEVVNNLLMMEI